MIAKGAIKDFLARPHDDFTHLKALSEAEVDALIAGLDPVPRFATHNAITGKHQPMRLHQKVAFLLGIAYPQFYFTLDMGLGKSRVILEIFDYRRLLGEVTNCLVLTPTDTIAEGWAEQVATWKPHIPITLLLGSTKEKRDRLVAHEWGLVAAQYLGFAHMVTTREEAKKKKFVLERDDKWVKAVAALFDIAVWDEITTIGERDALLFSIFRLLTKIVPSRFGLAGRSFGRNPQKLWSQWFIIDRGYTLGETIGLFRAAFFDEKDSYFGGPRSMIYKFRTAMAETLHEFIGHRSIVYDIDDCLDLPPLLETPRVANLPSSTASYYKAIVEQAKEAKRRMNVFLRLRQLSSGFLGIPDDEDGEVAEVEFADNPKLDMLLDDVAALPPGRKMLIFHEFTWSGRRISAELDKLKIKHGWVWGGTKDYKTIKHRFDNDPDYPILILNHKKGAMGLNLQRANYIGVYESPVDPIGRDQMFARVRRDGQEASKLFARDYIIRDTMDERILEYIAEGDNLYAQVMRQPSLLHKLLRGRR